MRFSAPQCMKRVPPDKWVQISPGTPPSLWISQTAGRFPRYFWPEFSYQDVCHLLPEQEPRYFPFGHPVRHTVEKSGFGLHDTCRKHAHKVPVCPDRLFQPRYHPGTLHRTRSTKSTSPVHPMHQRSASCPIQKPQINAAQN